MNFCYLKESHLSHGLDHGFVHDLSLEFHEFSLMPKQEGKAKSTSEPDRNTPDQLCMQWFAQSSPHGVLYEINLT